MPLPEILAYALGYLRRQRTRSLMMLLSMTIGVAAVVVLVALGEGARRYVMGEFAFLGNDVLVMFPGRKSTTGGMPPVTGTAVRDITLEEVGLLQRNVPGIASVAPLVIGSASLAWGGRERDAVVLGTSAEFFPIRRLAIAQGESLPALDAATGAPVAVIGQTLKRELFGNRRAIGEWVRVRDYRFRVVGVLEGRGDSFGLDLSESVFVPVASAQSIFDVHGLFRVMFLLRPGVAPATASGEIEARMRDYHDGKEDVTVTSPEAMLRTFDGILRVLTAGVTGIGAISLLVAGVLVMNMMLLGVRQRTGEIGLLKALGATDAAVRGIFLSEAGLLALSGALLGVLAGLAIVLALGGIFSALPLHAPAWACLAAAAAAIATALLFAWLPASRAARLEPVRALGRQ